MIEVLFPVLSSPSAIPDSDLLLWLRWYPSDCGFLYPEALVDPPVVTPRAALNSMLKRGLSAGSDPAMMPIVSST